MPSTLDTIALGLVVTGFTVKGVLSFHEGSVSKGVATLLLAIANLLLIK